MQEVPPSATLAQKVEWLIQNMWPADAPAPTNNKEAAAAIAGATGEEISSTTVWKLRTGRQDNPQLKTLSALATFFDVPLGYFGLSGEATSIDDDLTLKALSREIEDGTIRPSVLRALVDLSPESRWLVEEMLLAAVEADRRRREERVAEGGG
ncbi:hypothetical protein [Spirillospora sp. CA-294931]|uniref:hypothetical protein n=1 Tax=Spirillospora sp. CA-294931 TaxID=3240042 RepID=UPI003D8D8610